MLLRRLGLFGIAALSIAALPLGAQTIALPVRTLAGSGALGMNDGPAASASFLVPTGLARASDGTIFVSDEAAQRIRAIKDGTVTTVAGSGTVGPLGMSVAGGYADGPALSARFDHPMGLAVGPGDALYIADAKNKMIRKLERGVVTTVVTGLTSPQDLAFDRRGNLWIADFRSGLKRWDGHALTTAVLPNIDTELLAVSVSPDAPNPKLVATTTKAVFEFDLDAAADGSGPYRGNVSMLAPTLGWTFGTPRQIVAIGKHQAIYSDPVTNTVRFLRFNVLPFASQPYSTRLAGGSDYKAIDNAGFADGADARFYAPRGILVAGDTIVVADAGNRRIRALPLPRFRSQEYGLEGAEPYDASHFEIALVGPSFVYWDSHDDTDSICGTIERRLDASGRIAKPVRCHSHRIDNGFRNLVWDYIENYLAPRHVDAYLVATPADVVDDAFVASARKLVGSTKARLLVVLFPRNWEISDGEDLVQRQTDYVSFPDDGSAKRIAEGSRVTSVLSGVPNLAAYDLFGDLVQYERGQNPPLFNAPDDVHPIARGNVFVGQHVADALLRSLPAAR